MKKFESQDIRNLGLFSHKSVGKTSLAEAILFTSGKTTRLGSVMEKTSNFDFEPEEVDRQMSINVGFGWTEFKKKKINIIDTPGDNNFVADAINCMQVVDSSVLLVSACDGVEIQTLKRWEETQNLGLPSAIFVNKMDRELADFDKVVSDVKTELAAKCYPVQLPIGKEDSFEGVVDLLSMKAYKYAKDLTGKNEVVDLPADLKDKADEFYTELVEAVAETDDDLLEKYLEEGEISNEELVTAFSKAMLSGLIVPVFCGSATKNVGIANFIDVVVKYFPSPLDNSSKIGVKPGTDEEIERKGTIDEAFSALVFKTVADQFAGKLSVFRVMSGKLSSDSMVLNATKDVKERIGQIFFMQGKKQDATSELFVGDIGAVAKLKETATGDTLTADKEEIHYNMNDLPKPAISFAIKPKVKGEEDKINQGLIRLREEDVTISIGRDDQTKDILISGMGQVHIEVIVEKLRRKFGVEVTLETPKVPYLETIKKKAAAEGKHKKQTGGRGQFGVCFLELEPQTRGDGFEFVNNIVGGSIPRQYIPAVEKGIIQAMEKGVIGGYPVVDIKARLYDGKYHDVDSSEMAFTIAGSKGFKNAAQNAIPTLLEPVMSMEITCPEENMGDIMGDLNSRRGKVLGMDSKGKNQIIKAQVPMSEVMKYQPDLTSMTSGRGAFTTELSHYEEVPGNLKEKIVAERKVADEEDD